MDNRHVHLLKRVDELSSGEDPGGALQRICMLLKDEVGHYDWVGYYLALPHERMLVLGPFEGAPTEHLKIPYGTGICGQAAERNDWFVVADVAAEDNYLACSAETRAEVVVPVTYDGRFVGELDIDSHTREPFTEFDDVLLAKVVEITAPLVAALAPPGSDQAPVER